MISLSQPLKLHYPDSLNPSEFWSSQSTLQFNIRKIFGDQLFKAPILEFNDVVIRKCCYEEFPKKIHAPIVIAVDDFTKIKEIAILYRIKVVAKPKTQYLRWLSTSIKKEVRTLIFSKDEDPLLFSSRPVSVRNQYALISFTGIPRPL